MGSLNKIILHWTAGADGLIDIEAGSYHFIVSRTGEVFSGVHKPEANIAPVVKGKYAAHTLNCNTNAIGVALDAMAGAKESPFNAGKYPITSVQVDAFVKLVAGLCYKYNIPVTKTTVLTHAEVQTNLGIKQNQKWDINWLPHMAKPNSNPNYTGDYLRALVQKELDAITKLGAIKITDTPKQFNFWKHLFELIGLYLGVRK